MEHTRNVLGSINDNLGAVDDVDDDASLTTVRSVGDQAETASLNETLKHLKVPTRTSVIRNKDTQGANTNKIPLPILRCQENSDPLIDFGSGS